MQQNKIKELCKENNIKFTDGRFESHLNLDNAGIRIDSFVINWLGNPIDGKKVIRQVYTPKTKNKGWGKGEVSFFLSEPKSPEFATIIEFIEYYKNN